MTPGRRAWLDAAPEALRHRLPALEDGPLGLPRFLKASDPDAREAVAAVRAALGAGTAAAMLRWYGSGAGPWSGYPAHESVAEVLLGIVGAEALIAAGAQSEDEAVLLGLARFLGRHGAAPRERGLAGEALRERLGALVERRCDEDARARFEAAMHPALRTRDGRPVGDAAFASTLGGAIVCGESLVVLDDDRVRRFDPGETRGEVLQVLPSAHAEIAADGGRAVIVTLVNEGEVRRVPIEGGDAEVIAQGQERPMSPAALDGRAAWLEQVRLPEHRTATRVRLEGREAPIHEHKEGAWDLLACGGALLWARHGGSLWSTLFGKNIHRADLLRWDPDTGRARVIDVLEGGDDGTSVPRLFTDGEVIAWTSGQRIGVIEPATGARRWVEVGAEIEGVRPLGADLLVAVAREHEGELVRLSPGGERRTLARWRRALWERERPAVIGDQVVWNAGEHLWAVPVSAGIGR